MSTAVAPSATSTLSTKIAKVTKCNRNKSTGCKNTATETLKLYWYQNRATNPERWTLAWNRCKEQGNVRMNHSKYKSHRKIEMPPLQNEMKMMQKIWDEVHDGVTGWKATKPFTRAPVARKRATINFPPKKKEANPPHPPWNQNAYEDIFARLNCTEESRWHSWLLSLIKLNNFRAVVLPNCWFQSLRTHLVKNIPACNWPKVVVSHVSNRC